MPSLYSLWKPHLFAFCLWFTHFFCVPLTFTGQKCFETPCLVNFFFNPITGQDRPWGFQEVEAPGFQDKRHMKVVWLSALSTGRLYPPRNIRGTHFCQRLSQPLGLSAAGRIMWMKNSIDNIGNRIRDLPTCSAVPQPTARPRAPISYQYDPKITKPWKRLILGRERTNVTRRLWTHKGFISFDAMGSRCE